MNLAASIPANDNHVIDLCRACGERGARNAEALCGPCDADVREHLAAYYGDDDEGACYAAGLNPGKF